MGLKFLLRTREALISKSYNGREMQFEYMYADVYAL